MLYQPQQQQHQHHHKPMQKQIDDFAFLLDDVLGEGAFGKVFKGKNVKTSEIVAIKMITKNKNFDSKLIQTEIKNMEALKSKNIVQILKFAETVNNIYLIVEYCENGDLEGLLKKQPKGYLDEKKCIDIIGQLLKGFQVMHKLGYVHRDIKPANVLINHDIYKLADLGLSKQTQENKMMQSVCGTPLYMSPQILFHKEYSDKADIWSLGLMFYEMLFGKYPWVIRDMRALKKAVSSEPLRFPIDKPISMQTKLLITKMLQTEEVNRISWDELFKHELFEEQTIRNTEKFQEFSKIDERYQNFQIDKKVKQIIQKMQDIVAYHDDPNQYIRTIFHNFDKTKCGSLEKTEFFKFLSQIEQNISQEHAQQIFNMIDKDNNGSLSFDEFQEMFNGYDFSDIDDKSGQLLKDIRAIVKANNIVLKDIFQRYDRFGKGSLNFNEFQAFISIIAQGLKKDDVQHLFNRFDHDGDGSLTFKEVYDTIMNNVQAPASRKNSNCNTPQNNLQLRNKQNSNNNNNNERRYSKFTSEEQKDMANQLVSPQSSDNPYAQQGFPGYSRQEDQQQQQQNLTPQQQIDQLKMQNQTLQNKNQYLESQLNEARTKIEMLQVYNKYLSDKQQGSSSQQQQQ